MHSLPEIQLTKKVVIFNKIVYFAHNGRYNECSWLLWRSNYYVKWYGLINYYSKDNNKIKIEKIATATRIIRILPFSSGQLDMEQASHSIFVLLVKHHGSSPLSTLMHVEYFFPLNSNGMSQYLFPFVLHSDDLSHRISKPRIDLLSNLILNFQSIWIFTVCLSWGIVFIVYPSAG